MPDYSCFYYKTKSLDCKHVKVIKHLSVDVAKCSRLLMKIASRMQFFGNWVDKGLLHDIANIKKIIDD